MTRIIPNFSHWPKVDDQIVLAAEIEIDSDVSIDSYESDNDLKDDEIQLLPQVPSILDKSDDETSVKMPTAIDPNDSIPESKTKFLNPNSKDTKSNYPHYILNGLCNDFSSTINISTKNIEKSTNESVILNFIKGDISCLTELKVDYKRKQNHSLEVLKGDKRLQIVGDGRAAIIVRKSAEVTVLKDFSSYMSKDYERYDGVIYDSSIMYRSRSIFKQNFKFIHRVAVALIKIKTRHVLMISLYAPNCYFYPDYNLIFFQDLEIYLNDIIKHVKHTIPDISIVIAGDFNCITKELHSAITTYKLTKNQSDTINVLNSIATKHGLLNLLDEISPDGLVITNHNSINCRSIDKIVLSQDLFDSCILVQLHNKVTLGSHQFFDALFSTSETGNLSMSNLKSIQVENSANANSIVLKATNCSCSKHAGKSIGSVPAYSTRKLDIFADIPLSIQNKEIIPDGVDYLIKEQVKVCYFDYEIEVDDTKPGQWKLKGVDADSTDLEMEEQEIDVEEEEDEDWGTDEEEDEDWSSDEEEFENLERFDSDQKYRKVRIYKNLNLNLVQLYPLLRLKYGDKTFDRAKKFSGLKQRPFKKGSFGLTGPYIPANVAYNLSLFYRIRGIDNLFGNTKVDFVHGTEPEEDTPAATLVTKFNDDEKSLKLYYNKNDYVQIDVKNKKIALVRYIYSLGVQVDDIRRSIGNIGCPTETVGNTKMISLESALQVANKELYRPRSLVAKKIKELYPIFEQNLEESILKVIDSYGQDATIDCTKFCFSQGMLIYKGDNFLLARSTDDLIGIKSLMGLNGEINDYEFSRFEPNYGEVPKTFKHFSVVSDDENKGLIYMISLQKAKEFSKRFNILHLCGPILFNKIWELEGIKEIMKDIDYDHNPNLDAIDPEIDYFTDPIGVLVINGIKRTFHEDYIDLTSLLKKCSILTPKQQFIISEKAATSNGYDKLVTLTEARKIANHFKIDNSIFPALASGQSFEPIREAYTDLFNATYQKLTK
ncbi:uncharacterized protein KGF55_000438 [Candida pseudojiufengensis]|uniref:uncharacterized protein n=1 Tax=Candida pseudojiufengensis TaxID=497109 RepID=UPI0022242177|nr:uncharacterized protein KGF55_000438 [Candida pseudojiufengensis]KAI5967028.1 hypothetical protein KGF55_000438 [Candida pseudojiufengensis]